MSIAEEVECLRRIPLFANIDVAKLKLLAFTSERMTFKAGEELFHQDDPGNSAYIVLDGEAEVVIHTAEGTLPVAVLGRSEIVGEIAILCDVPRTATVRARNDLTTLCISKELFFRLVTEFPQIAVQIMRVLAHRLDQTLRALRRHGVVGA
ncbi:cyclic nucleotide-binding domain-containing protein [Azospirillum sp. ST 5-10]|uniref:cyclic nucleotide-binding domain-containing protein n=1 Tax=unclassified Azospirillum TaxID=2630922 RepID=UPI003F4A4857